MTGLPCQHRDLAPVVRIVRHQIGEETRDVWFEALDLPVAFKCPSE
ncbi:MAG: hypothetical protein JWN34_3052, partial [Bryobacterales bacterium]|nr:hypothetical protein [Bryobacterales bacterium]